MIICDQFTTTDGRIVTKFFTKNLWTVSTKDFTRRFYDELDYWRYMTK